MPSVTLFQIPPEPAPPEPAPPPPPIMAPGSQAGQVHPITERIAPMHVLRRTGYRPVAFNGRALGTVCGIDQVLPYWYEINVYQTVIGAYISDIRLFGKGVDTTDLFRVAEHDDADALHAYLERYDPCADLPPIRYDEAATSAAALTLRAIEVQAEMRRITDHYRATVGALLHELPG